MRMLLASKASHGLGKIVDNKSGFLLVPGTPEAIIRNFRHAPGVSTPTAFSKNNSI